jgi:integrase
VKSWAFRYRFHGEQRRLVFGTYPALSLAEVRVKLAEAKKQLEAGHDPGALMAVVRHALRTAPTVEDIVQDYLRHAALTMRRATVREDRRILEKEVLPKWRRRLAQDITRRDIMTLLNAIEDRGVYVLRNRVAGVLSRLFLYALNQGMVNGSPAIQLPRLRKIKERKVEQARSRFLSKDEIRAFWHNLAKVPLTPSTRAALKWALVSGQRRGEVAGTKREEEIDDAATLWRIPPERTKNGHEQLLPLPPIALEVLAEADAARVRPQPTRLKRKDRRPYNPTPSPWLFPSVRHDRPVTPEALTCAVVRHRAALGIGDATVHDLRRTMATWLGELGIAKDLISALLNHAPKGVTDQHYNKASMLGPKRHAMNVWSDWLGRVIAGDQVEEDVIPIASQRARV